MPVWKLREKGCCPNGSLYLLVDIWFGADATGEPDLTNDFVLDIPRFENPIIKNASGDWLHINGRFIRENVAVTMDPALFQRQQTEVDVRQRVTRLIDAYIQRAMAKGYRGDHTGDASKPFFVGNVRVPQTRTVTIERDTVDRRGQLSTVGEVELRR